jgi:hypothetical protein
VKPEIDATAGIIPPRDDQHLRRLSRVQRSAGQIGSRAEDRVYQDDLAMNGLTETTYNRLIDHASTGRDCVASGVSEESRREWAASTWKDLHAARHK